LVTKIKTIRRPGAAAAFFRLPAVKETVKYKLKMAVTPLLGFALTCGAPLAPATYSWRVITTFLGGRYSGEDIAAVRDAIFFAVLGPDGDITIRRYVNGEVKSVFVVDLKGAKYAVIKDIAAAGTNAWAVGWREFEINDYAGWRLEPFLVKFDGVNWSEINVQSILPPGELINVAPINGRSCWLIFRAGTFGNFGNNTLWLYDKGVLKEFPQITNIEVVTYDAETRTTFGLASPNGGHIFVSGDGGASWVEEVAKLPTPWPNYRPDKVTALARAGVLYVATTDTDGTPFAGAIYRRSGPPGRGYYELLFSCPANANFGGIASIAADDRGRILAVGKWTSAYYDGSRWTLEELPDRNDFYDVTVGNDGFYAVANDENWNLEILYHP